MKFPRFAIFLLTFTLGIALTLQFKNPNNNYKYVPINVIYNYNKSLEKEKAEINNLKTLKYNLINKIKDYESASEKDENMIQLILEQIKEYKMLSGITDLEGPGIIVIMDDATRDLYEGEDPNNLLVHNIDVLNIVNDLKVAGAEAISINGQRLLSNSEIDCSGYTIKINNEEYGMPIIIKAIGEPKQLEAAIKAPGTYGNLLKEIGLFIEVNTSISIKIPGYKEGISFSYLKTKEGD